MTPATKDDRNKYRYNKVPNMLQTAIFDARDLKRGVNQIRREISELGEMLAVRRLEKACRDIKYQLAAARFETALVRHAVVCRKAGFRQDQPRWPKDSGRAAVGRRAREHRLSITRRLVFRILTTPPRDLGKRLPRSSTPCRRAAGQFTESPFTQLSAWRFDLEIFKALDLMMLKRRGAASIYAMARLAVFGQMSSCATTLAIPLRFTM